MYIWHIRYKIISLTKYTMKILNTTQPLYLYDLIYIQPPHGHNTRPSLYVTLIKPSSSLSHSSILPTCFTSSLEPSYTPLRYYSSSELLIPLSATFIWTCWFNFLHTATTFDHFSLFHWAQTLPFSKILSSTLVCSCLSDWSHGSRLFIGLLCSSVLRFSSSFFWFSYS